MDVVMADDAPIDRLAELRRQFHEWERSDYDGHNRKPGADRTDRALRNRRKRRRTDASIRERLARTS